MPVQKPSTETKTPALTVAECVGGYSLSSPSLGRGHYGIVGHATQRDPHPHYGGGISYETACATAQLWAAARLMRDACEEAEIALEAWAANYPGLSGVDATTRAQLRAALAAARGEVSRG